MAWIEDRWHQVAGATSGTWLAWAVWAMAILGVIALLYANLQIRRNRRLATEQTRPHVGMFMEPHAADWHLIELVVRNFGKTAAYDVQFAFPHAPTVAEYENASNGYADVVELELLRSLLTYSHHATKETRADVFRSEIARTNRAVEETKDRWRTRQIDAPPTDVSLRRGDARAELGKHCGERAV